MKVSILLFLLFPFISNTAFSQSWTKIATVPDTKLVHGVSFTIGNKLYAGGGFGKSFYQYDPATNTWTKKHDLPGVDTERTDGIAFTIGDKGYIGLGFDGQKTAIYKNDLWQYDTATDAWTRKADFPEPIIYGASTFVIGDKAYVGGGSYSVDSYYAHFYEYDPSADKWSQKTDIPPDSLRFGLSMFSIGQYGYAVGGVDWVLYNDMYRYDPTNDSWKQMSSYPGGGRTMCASFVVNNIGYVGLGLDSTNTYKDFYSYDPLMDAWSGPIMFSGAARFAPVSGTIGNIAYVGSGSKLPGASNDWWSFSPTLSVNPGRREVNNLHSYPQPAESIVYISGLANEKLYDVQVYDVTGKIVMHTSVTSNTDQDAALTVQSLKAGLYEVIVSGDGSRQSFSIIKNN